MSARSDIVRVAHSIHRRGLTHGRTGNLAVREGENILVTPTGVCLSDVASSDLSLIGMDGAHIEGPRPTKESFLHAAMLRARPSDRAVVHTHSVYSAALSTLDLSEQGAPLPILTAYFAMRVPTLRVLPYIAPGDTAAAEIVESAAVTSGALLLRNHGPVVAAGDLDAALDALEELEHVAQIFFLTHGMARSPLTPEAVAALTPSTGRPHQ